MKLREEFVLRALGKAQPFAEVCREFQVSRKTGYKWLERYQEQGLTGLVDESRRPDSSPTKVDDELVAVILGLRREFPTWGPKKLRALLQRRKPGVPAPAEGTIARLLRENGLVRKPRRRPSSGGPPVRPPQLDPLEPNDVWTVDFKGWWRTRDGVRCEPLTVRDALSRYLLGVRLLSSTATEDVMPEFELLFDKYGLPKTIQTDNGAPFASTRGIGGLSQLSAWWVSLGINVVRSRPGCPQDNGGHERMHGDMVALQHVSAPTVREQQRVLDEWVTTFNHVRPHEALGLKTPAEFYRPSPRRRSHHRIGGFPLDVRLVNVRGRYAHFDDCRIHVGAAFAGYPVGIRPLDSERVEVWFFHMRLGTCRPNMHGSFEVDPALLSPAPGQRRSRDVPERRTSLVRRTAGTALLLASSGTDSELAHALKRTTVALLGVGDVVNAVAEHGCHHDSAPSASDGAAGAAITREPVTSTDAANVPANDGAAGGATSVSAQTVTSGHSGCNPPPETCHPECHPASSERAVTRVAPPEVTPLAVEVTPVTQGEVTPVTGGGDTSGLQVSPPPAVDADRTALRLQPPTIPVGWPWVSDASRRSRQRKPSTKGARTTK